jgi:hypothetical protein
MPPTTLAPNTGLVIRKPPGAKQLEDNALWKSRFEIHSATSNRVYIVAQNKASGLFSCSCPGWKIHRTCKHLKDGMGLSDKQIHGRVAMQLKKQDSLNAY